jgi:hypothetical protein
MMKNIKLKFYDIHLKNIQTEIIKIEPNNYNLETLRKDISSIINLEKSEYVIFHNKNKNFILLENDFKLIREQSLEEAEKQEEDKTLKEQEPEQEEDRKEIDDIFYIIILIGLNFNNNNLGYDFNFQMISNLFNVVDNLLF